MLSKLIKFLRASGRSLSDRSEHTKSDVAGKQERLLWYKDTGQHLNGKYSMAVVQANNSLEDQSQIESGCLSLLDSGPYGTFVGVYDGHGGPETSRYINDHLLPNLKRFTSEQQSISVDVIRKAFQATEEGFLSLVTEQWPIKPQIAAVGSSCLVGVICGGTLYIANLGESRAVMGKLVKATRKVVAIQLSAEHHANIESVREELHKLHPDDPQIVVLTHNVWRVKGLIQVSRSIGDVYLKKAEFNREPLYSKFRLREPFKRPILSSEPSISVHELQSDDQFLIFASDGLWEHLSNQDAVDLVQNHPPAGSAKRLVKAALLEAAKKREMKYSDLKKIERGIRRHFHDDITVVVVFLDSKLVSRASTLKGPTDSNPIDEQIEPDEMDLDESNSKATSVEMDLDESNSNATSVNWKLANSRHLCQLRSGFPTPDEQNLSAPDPKSRGEEDSEHLQLQLHQYSDATIGISEHGSTSGTAPERGVLSMEESIRLNEMGEVVTQGQKFSPEDKESLTRETDEVSHSEELLEEIRLEELEETSSNPRELEQLNCDPMEVPATISHHFSILRVLDLSYTEINSLPPSISILVALQKLFLRSCELLMELPPEIGELTNLEVLDLEGTEILYLPKEIAKLVNLTSLKVSFYGYANQRVIPQGVLPNLSRLIELIIDVTPYGVWWDDEVKDITDDLFSLDELRTLKLYLPTAELLEGLTWIFSGLANFRFTVGRHEEHFISRLPHDVEEEFNNREKMEKGLKFINGNHIPNEITKVLKHANAFVLQRHWTAKSLSDFGHENMNEVKFCLVTECNEFRTIIDSEQFYRGKNGSGESEDFQDSDDVIALGLLEKLIVRFMKNIVSIWNGPVGKGCLSNLKSLALHTCPSLTTLFTIDMLSNLIYLEELIVEDCPKIDSLVSLKSSGSESGLSLPNMKKISLLELPELVSISSGLCIAPKLERMVIFYCPKLEKLSTMDVSSTNLKVIKGEKEWWDALKWYESDLSAKHEDHLARIFIPLRRDEDLMAQLTKD